MTFRQSLVFGLRYFFVSLLFCLCLGAFLYLERTAVGEPLLHLMVEGKELQLCFFGLEKHFSLLELERLAASLRNLWIFLPPPFRLLLKAIFCLLEQ